MIVAVALFAAAGTRAFAGEMPTSAVYPAFRPDKALEEEKLTEADLREIETGKTIVRSRPMPPGKKGAHVMAARWVMASQNQAYAVVMDCKGQPGYVPHLLSCTNTFPEGSTAPVVPYYEQTEKLKFGFAFISKEVNYTIRAFTMRPFMRGWTLKGGDISACEGYFRILPYKDGHQILLYDLYLDPGTVLPGWIQEILTKSDLPKTVEAYARQAENVAAASK